MILDIPQEDACVIQAILLTHAEMQDNRVIPSMELMTRLKKDNTGTETEQDVIEDLEDQIEGFEDDCVNLRRLAKYFGEQS